RPAGVVLMSPWTDLTGSGASLVRNAAVDPLLPAARFADLVGFALGDHPRDDPRVSPLFAAHAGAPPVLIQHSGTEILADDSTRLAARLRDQGVAVTLGVWPDAPHAWPVLAPRLPESQAAIAQAAGFLRDCLSPR
ncbi:MAG: alpha/beta hydrolase fold domain-containing protein, partial [Rhodobacterales bacterium]|nr:alpha/beta hydrolase fold domain-containing protein [Rhodobacterales bacterium]